MRNCALWKRALADAWVQLAASCALLAAFGWLFVWMMSLFKMGAWGAFLNLLPDFVQPLLGVPLSELATPAGRLSFLFVHVVTLLVCLSWAIGRGSDIVSGRIAKGTMELLLTLPVRRASILAVPSIVTSAGAGLLAISVWIGAWAGVWAVGLSDKVQVVRFCPAVVNLFAMTFCLGGIATLFSAWDHDRWRPIWLTGGFFVVSAVVEMVSRLWEPASWLAYLSFMSAFDPQRLSLLDTGRLQEAIRLDGALLGLGFLGYGLATAVFVYRDIPVPR